MMTSVRRNGPLLGPAFLLAIGAALAAGCWHAGSSTPSPVVPPDVAAANAARAGAGNGAGGPGSGAAAATGDVGAAVAAEAPVTLTASDGTGLRLVQMTGRAVVEDPLAFTELHLAFENPNERTLEGTFRITLPQGASVGRFAMKIGDTWQEG